MQELHLKIHSDDRTHVCITTCGRCTPLYSTALPHVLHSACASLLWQLDNCCNSLSAYLQLKGIGGVANIVQADIPACASSIIHITDAVLLPLQFAAASIATPSTATSG